MNKEKLNDIICESSSDYDILNDTYNYIENLEQQCKKQKEVIEKAIKNEEEIMYLANKVAITTQNVEIKAVRDRLEEIFDILKEVK